MTIVFCGCRLLAGADEMEEKCHENIGRPLVLPIEFFYNSVICDKSWQNADSIDIQWLRPTAC